VEKGRPKGKKKGVSKEKSKVRLKRADQATRRPNHLIVGSTEKGPARDTPKKRKGKSNKKNFKNEKRTTTLKKKTRGRAPQGQGVNSTKKGAGR